MSKLTTNLRLVKPELNDTITPTIFAENFDVIDEAIANLNSGTSLNDLTTTFGEDGSITETYATGRYTITTFGDDGNITMSLYTSDDILSKVKRIVFNDDGSISEIVTDE